MQDSFSFQGGFIEATACVSDLDRHSTTLCAIGGWEIVAEGSLPRELLAGWGLDAGSGRFRLLGNPGDNSGYLRLHQLSGVSQGWCRPNPQTWDTGGIIDINIRVLDLPAKYRALQQAGYTSTADPVRWTFGPSTVEEWIGIGPDGLAIAIIERLAPPLEGWDTLKAFSRVFNSSQIVTDMTAAMDFYCEVLGFQAAVHQRAPMSEAPGANVLGIPHNLVPEIEVEIAILHPSGLMDGSVELVKFHGLEGRDFSDCCLPWNLGISSLRFRIEGLDALLAHVQAQGVASLMSPMTLDLAPWGAVRMAAIAAPTGARLELFETA